MNDPLAQFRRDKGSSGESSTPYGSDDYEAFKAVDRRQIRLAVRPTNHAWERVPYGYLLRVVEDGIYGTELCLVYTFAVFVILGRNLSGIADAIADERCEFVQEYDPSRWAMPTDEKAPFVESIEVHVQKLASEPKGSSPPAH
jgi:hypothetical protein